MRASLRLLSAPFARLLRAWCQRGQAGGLLSFKRGPAPSTLRLQYKGRPTPTVTAGPLEEAIWQGTSSAGHPTPRTRAIDAHHSQASAEARAKQLLLRHLNSQQRAQFDACGNFSVNVAGRGVFYIFPCLAFNVVHTPTGDCYCCSPEARVPLSDLMLSQKLLLETDPEQFFRVANCKPKLVIDVPQRGLCRSRRSAPHQRNGCEDALTFLYSHERPP